MVQLLSNILDGYGFCDIVCECFLDAMQWQRVHQKFIELYTGLIKSEIRKWYAWVRQQTRNFYLKKKNKWTENKFYGRCTFAL